MKSTYIYTIISNFSEQSHLNKIEEKGIEKIYEEPLIGIADADDYLFEKLKDTEVVGPNHKSPKEWLKNAKSVITYFLPFSSQIRKANHKPGLPASEWLYGRIEGEECNKGLLQHLVKEINNFGEEAIAPMLDFNFTEEAVTSNWSERHVAFAAGLGTFGLSKSLITRKGCAGRYGSVVTTMKLDFTPRKYENIYEYCTMCGICISRCPAGAIKKEGKDNLICKQYFDEKIYPKYFPYYGCGKCQTAVPCETTNPNK